MSASWTFRRASLCYCLVVVLALPALTAEVVVQNDSFEPGGSVTIVGDFIAGEQAGVRLTSPCDGSIVAVQIAWLEGAAGQGESLERAIHIYDGSAFPTPGQQLETLIAPLLTPGYLNEFRYLDEAQTIPLEVPVSTGQQFYVTLEFETPTDVNAGSASVVRDVDGCQGGKNALYAIPGGWLDFCIFLSGDLVMRAVVDCPEPCGACCFEGGGCLVLTAANCATAAGDWAGASTDCSDHDQNGIADACHPPSTCAGDTDYDGYVGLTDLATLLGEYGRTSGATWAHGDFDGDGDVDLVDLAAMLGNYNTYCS